jgi:hypothetical protein
MVIFLVVKFVRSESVRVRELVKLRQGERGERKERGRGEEKETRYSPSHKP